MSHIQTDSSTSNSFGLCKCLHDLRADLMDEWYRQVSNIRRTLVGNQIIDRSDVVGASPVGVVPTTSSFST